MNPRNKSHIKYDVIMGQLFENILIDYFTNHLKSKQFMVIKQIKNILIV